MYLKEDLFYFSVCDRQLSGHLYCFILNDRKLRAVTRKLFKYFFVYHDHDGKIKVRRYCKRYY